VHCRKNLYCCLSSVKGAAAAGALASAVELRSRRNLPCIARRALSSVSSLNRLRFAGQLQAVDVWQCRR
jgi:hypothetical protein